MSRGTNSIILKTLTQRLVLSLVSKVYNDPLGLVAPFTVGALLILKDNWRVIDKVGMKSHLKTQLTDSLPGVLNCRS